MYPKISGQSSKSNYKNSGSSAGAVFYDEHDLREYLDEALELGAQSRQMQFFDMEGHVVTAAEVMDKVDRHHSGLHKNDAKFFCLMLDPSDQEIAAMGANLPEQLTNGQQYVFDVMDAYARNFKREGIDDRHNLTAFAIPHLYKGKDKKEQLHWHVIVARKDASNKYKLSPLTNHRGTTKGAVKGGFDRVAFDRECEMLFDKRFGYERKVEDSFDYCLAQKKGTPEQKAEQTLRLANQNRPELEVAVKAFLDHRVAQLAAEAKSKAEKERQEKEENAKKEAARLLRIRSNEFWNEYHSKYRPEYIRLKEACEKSFELYRTAKEEYGIYSELIEEEYNDLRAVYNQMKALQDDIQKARTAKIKIRVIASLVFFINPIAAFLFLFVEDLIIEAERKDAITDRKKLRAQAADIKNSINVLRIEQAILRQDKKDTLKAYLENKEAKVALQSEINDLKAIIDQKIEKHERLKDARNESREAIEKIKSGIQQLKEQTRPKIDLSKIDFAAMGRKAAAQRLVTPTTTSLSGSSKDVQSKTQFDLYSLILSAKDKKSLERDLNSNLSVMKSLKDSVGGVTDFEITLAREGRVTTASSLFSEEQMRKVFNKWEALTGEKPAYSLETERTNRRQPEDIHRKIETVSPQNRFEQSKGGGPTKKR